MPPRPDGSLISMLSGPAARPWTRPVRTSLCGSLLINIKDTIAEGAAIGRARMYKHFQDLPSV